MSCHWLNRILIRIQLLFHIKAHSCFMIIYVLQVLYARFKLEFESHIEFAIFVDKYDRIQLIEHIYELLHWLNPLIPDLLIANYITYATYFAISVPRLTSAMFDLRKNFHIDYLEKSVPARKQHLERQLNVIIHELLDSNANFVANLIKPRIKNGYNNLIGRSNSNYYKFYNNDDGFDNTRAHSNSELNRTCDDDYLYKSSSCLDARRRELSEFYYHYYQYNSTSIESNSHHHHHHHRFEYNTMTIEQSSERNNFNPDDLISYQLRFVRCEFNYLQRLLNDKRYIWPEHRTAEWLAKLRLIWFSMKVVVVASFNLLGFLGMHTILEMSYNYKSENKMIIEKPSWIKTIIIIEMYITLHLSCDFATDPIIDTLIDRTDSVKLVSSFNVKVDKFRSAASKLRHKIEIVNTIYKSNQFEMKNSFVNLVQLELDRFECNKLSLQAYITLRYIILQYRSSKSNIHGNVNQVVATALITICLIFISAEQGSRITPGEYRLMWLYGICIVGYVNGTFICIAAFNVQYMNIIKRIWSISHVSTINIIEDDSAALGKPCSACNYQYLERKQNFLLSNQTANRSNQTSAINSRYLTDNSSIDILRYSIISPHLLSLWSRSLQHEQSHLADLFTCNLFGLISVDYKSIIKLNFWALSIFIIFKIYTAT